RGRYREFWQFGVELIGSSKPEADAEVINLAYLILKELKIKFNLEIGHVGLLRHLLRNLDETQASRIMRLIDKGDIDGLNIYMDQIKLDKEIQEKVFDLIGLKGSREVVGEAREVIPDFDFSHIEILCDLLDSLDVEYNLDLGIARGLDYYTGVVFECYAEGLGAQKQICGGGSYELSHLFGGDRTPSTGFAIGFDRVAELCEVEIERKPVVAVVSFSGLEREAFKVANILRKKGISAVVDVMQRSIRRQLSYANDIKAKFVVIVGKREIKEGKVALKDLSTGEQKTLKIEDAIEIITNSSSRKKE
ncbi:MAG: histidine--tRNA ligase, partial [Candidatus Methanomethylicota archaeon]